MTDERDVTTVLRTMARDADPAAGRVAVARKVRRHRMRQVGAATFAVVALGVGSAIVVTSNDHEDRPPVAADATAAPRTDSTVTTQPGDLTIDPDDEGVLVWPRTVGQGGTFEAVVRNPAAEINALCFSALRVERWTNDRWEVAAEQLVADDVDPNLVGPGADCAPEPLLPNGFVGAHDFTIPDDLPVGQYRVVEPTTDLEGRIQIKPCCIDSLPLPPVGNYTIDLSLGGELGDAPTTEVERAVLLDDSRLALSWRSACNAPARKLFFVYGVQSVTANLTTGTFGVKDCVGELDEWSVVVDLPAPLWGRPVTVRANSGADVVAKRVAVEPISAIALPDASSEPRGPEGPTSMSDLRATDRAIEFHAYASGCIDAATSLAFRSSDGEVFVQTWMHDHRTDVCRGGPRAQDAEVYVGQPIDAGDLFGPVAG
jgi:hypothetical protein